MIPTLCIKCHLKKLSCTLRYHGKCLTFLQETQVNNISILLSQLLTVISTTLVKEKMTEQKTKVTSVYDNSVHIVGGPLLLMHSVKEKVYQILQLLRTTLHAFA